MNIAENHVPVRSIWFALHRGFVDSSKVLDGFSIGAIVALSERLALHSMRRSQSGVRFENLSDPREKPVTYCMALPVTVIQSTTMVLRLPTSD